MEYILTFWADGSAVGLVDLLTSLRKLCLFYPLFSLFWKREVGGQGPPIPLAYHIISYHNAKILVSSSLNEGSKLVKPFE